MSEGWAVVAGAFIGGITGLVGSLSNAWFTDYLTNERKDKLDEGRKILLRQMLEDQRFDWRKLSTLAHVVGADFDTAKRLLLEIDARASEDGTDLWGLISRHPFPRSN